MCNRRSKASPKPPPALRHVSTHTHKKKPHCLFVCLFVLKEFVGFCPKPQLQTSHFGNQLQQWEESEKQLLLAERQRNTLFIFLLETPTSPTKKITEKRSISFWFQSFLCSSLHIFLQTQALCWCDLVSCVTRCKG